MPHRPKTNGAAGFTLLEVLLALAVIALISGLAVINADAIFSGFDDKPLPEILKKAVRESRFLAATSKETVFLTFDSESSRFLIISRNGGVIQSLPTGYDPEDENIEIRLYQILPSTGTGSRRGFAAETRPVQRIGFYPDRSSTPFEVHLFYDETESRHRYDPFSDAEFDYTDR